MVAALQWLSARAPFLSRREPTTDSQPSLPPRRELHVTGGRNTRQREKLHRAVKVPRGAGKGAVVDCWQGCISRTRHPGDIVPEQFRRGAGLSARLDAPLTRVAPLKPRRGPSREGRSRCKSICRSYATAGISRPGADTVEASSRSPKRAAHLHRGIQIRGPDGGSCSGVGTNAPTSVRSRLREHRSVLPASRRNEFDGFATAF